ncbi:four helix bundle protein [Owenweeksia hongkongensis]|uniref:four helix bundle protein n=1 Tax=Owenweeksia hongkongensis TaxID=253245 RepID=UPI003A8E9BF4
MHNFKELKIWQKSMELVSDVYQASLNMPKSQQYSLVDQIQRSAVSIPSNIAEGSGRGTNNEFVRFLNISNGSCCELETQLLIAQNLNFLEKETAVNMI